MDRIGTSGRAGTRRDDNPSDKPHDAFAERCLVGSVLLESRSFDEIGSIVRDSDFYLAETRIIFSTALRMYTNGKTIDAATVGDELASDNMLERVGGVEWIIDCLESVPHAAHAVHYAKIIAEKAQRRSLSFVGTDAIHSAIDLSKPVDESVAEVESSLAKVLERKAGNQTSDIRSILIEAMDGMRSGKGRGIPTGFTELDKILIGMCDQNLMVVAARPSIGKTAFGTNIALSVAQRGIPAGLITLEQAPVEIGERLISSHCRMSVTEMRKPCLSEAQLDSILKSAAALGDLPLMIDGCEYRGIAAIEASCRLMVRKKGVKLIVVDYLQLISGQERRDVREQEVAEISRRLKWIAKSLSIPIIALAQLNRENEKRTDKRPKLSDLRESGSIEQDADVVILLHRDEFYDATNNPGIATVIVAKNRNGRIGEVQMQFQSEFMQFRDLAPSYQRSVPVSINQETQFDDQGLPVGEWNF